MTAKSQPTNGKPQSPETRVSWRALNRLKNGSKMVRLSVGELPTKLSRVTRYVRKYREILETEVAEAHGEISLTQAHLIDSACGWEQALGVLRWLLREKLAVMSVADIRECVKSQATARDNRNKAVMALELDRPPANPWDAIDVPSEEKCDEQA